MREPGLKLLTRLAGLYNVDVRDLVRCAGLSDDGVPDPRIDEEAEVGHAFEYVLADPRFRFGTRPSGPMSLDAKRFIVEMYERFNGKEASRLMRTLLDFCADLVREPGSRRRA